uniref:ATP synthase F0 subunit 8 n=1 Tax=Enoplometopus debelius TaxID=360513 RepID=A0A0U1XIS6_9EUCA|nr:ATP synthase F0 subunit 8 [Enoplometopus debelius]AIU44728.1 ATP synthase F0 subunit 8 [Enoplometopus debelius]
MPQMAPLMWMNLFFMFLIGFLLFFIMNYFLKPTSQMKYFPIKKIQTHKNWSW